MKKTALSIGIAAAFMMSGSSVMAGTISGSDITTFTAETTAKASEVNGNFAAVRTAVNDNDTRITANQAAINAVDTSGIATNATAIAAIDTSGIATNAAAIAAIDTSGIVTNATAITALQTTVNGKLDTSALGANSAVLTAATTTSSNSVDGNASNIGALQTGVATLEGVVGDASSGLVKDVADLQAGVGCPSEMAAVGSICFDKAEYGAPQVNVDQRTALKICANAGKRLPTDAEWTMAAVAAQNDNTLGIVNMADGVYEWVADWTGAAQGLLRGDCTKVASCTQGTGIDLYLAWAFASGTGQGPNDVIGFRCAK